MKNLSIFLLILVSAKSFSQSQKEMYSIMEKTAQKLKEKSGAYSVSVGIVKDGKVYTKHYGEIDKGKGNKADDNTYFEIASVTKLFTGQLLAQAVLENKINLEDDIRKYLKESYPNLEYNGTSIKIKDLISYKTALPRNLPDDTEIRKTMSGETPFQYNTLGENYTKDHFKQDLQKVKLDTIPGTKYAYSNLSLELTGLMLENIYGKSYEMLLYENILSKAGMDQTKLELGKGEVLSNGYHSSGRLMPKSISYLWGAGGSKTKSTMGDMVKFLKYELDSKNSVVQESQRNINNSKGDWYGYFWDGFGLSEHGKMGYKHGGAFGDQTWFMIYPELNMGICLIVNISGPDTFPALYNSAARLANDLTITPGKKKTEGYYLKGENVVFTYTHPKNLNSKLINSASVAGSFNDWKTDNKNYQLTKKEDNRFELEIPKSRFEKGKTYSFKLVLNGEDWINASGNASNTDGTDDNNLTLKF
ncbi:CubicO group peptidase, beta-lactamase class C family [Chryseobacterium carnipullorum]|uniref:serine hydrolase n=1 Tax=Chryseobacterium carnipullorum TaxID=1124835 RepID=UPI00091C70F7|nr:serine hydrolase [Chryseobacterium carnipullorum]SHM71048.1 CubicO group peptidase, beta-lactamase class C family [Chryseobacterium carnipullorum]